MRTTLSLALAALLGAGAAAAADNEAGVPLSPGEAAGGWTLEAGGHAICRVTLMTHKSAAGFAASAGGACRGALPGDVAGWTPTGDGMALTGQDGRVLLSFDRW